eukprot:TRINITY_DN9698_c0_g5_i2.p1 TRINITY_DN9698_c0_g5~~TRINITY_DN9698_c0_g5_i2.p1  ORF type:complete len:318 (-),score=34.29 TRINITY_DN9698_c0_g5_i2:16-969(-)
MTTSLKFERCVGLVIKCNLRLNKDMGACCERTSQEPQSIVKVKMPLHVRYQVYHSNPVFLLDVREKSSIKIQVVRSEEVRESAAIAIFPVLYLFGGVLQDKVTNKAWKGNINGSKAELVEMKEMKTGRANPVLVLGEDFDAIFIIGGYDEKNAFIRQCEKYEVESDQWSQLPSLRQRSVLSAIALNQKLYAFDSIQNTGNYSILDLSKTNTDWRLITISIPMEGKLHSYGLSMQNDSTIALIFGGRDAETKKISAQAYVMDIETGSAARAEDCDLPVSVDFCDRWVKCGLKWFSVSRTDGKIYSPSSSIDNWVIDAI